MSAATFIAMSAAMANEPYNFISKRLAVKSLRRDTIMAYSIDPDTLVTLELLGAFGRATIVFDSSFDPMALSEWLGTILAGTMVEGSEQWQ